MPTNKPKLAKECAFANAQPTDNKSDREKGKQITRYWRNGGKRLRLSICAKLNGSNSIQLLC